MRRFLALLRQLPPESAVMTAERGVPLEEVWTYDRELLAQLVEVVSVGATERHRLRKPVTVKRPAAPSKRRNPDAVPPGEAAAQLAAMAGVPVRVA